MVAVTAQLRDKCFSGYNTDDHLSYYVRWVAHQTEITDQQYQTLLNIFDLSTYHRKNFIVVDDQLVPSRTGITYYKRTRLGLTTEKRAEIPLHRALKTKTNK